MSEVDHESGQIHFVGLVEDGDRILIVWLEHDDRVDRPAWAELDTNGSVRWVRRLPFFPVHIGLIDGQPTLVEESGAGTRVCQQSHDELECDRVSPLGGAQVSFGPHEIVFDFGIGMLRWSRHAGMRPVDLAGSGLRLRDVPSSVRVGPCGQHWVVLGASLQRLDALGHAIGRVDGTYRLAIVGDRTYALASAGDRGTDLCSGQPVRVPEMPVTFGASSQLVAAFLGEQGIATVQQAGHDDGQRWYQYDYGGDTETYYHHNAFESVAPSIVAAHIDLRSRLWLVTVFEGSLAVRILTERGTQSDAADVRLE